MVENIPVEVWSMENIVSMFEKDRLDHVKKETERQQKNNGRVSTSTTTTTIDKNKIRMFEERMLYIVVQKNAIRRGFTYADYIRRITDFVGPDGLEAEMVTTPATFKTEMASMDGYPKFMVAMKHQIICKRLQDWIANEIDSPDGCLELELHVDRRVEPFLMTLCTQYYYC
jgi:hypothetical protein